MIETLEWHPVSGSSITLNDLNYPLSSFEPEVDREDKQYKKWVAHGEWPSFSYAGAMRIPAEGRILATGADDTARATDYVTKRLALCDAFLPSATTPLTSRPHGYLRIKLYGMAEAADADGHIISFRAPMQALYPSNSEFFVTFKLFTPYFTGASTTVYPIG